MRLRYNFCVVYSCDERVYGYYADTENSCQVFHVCYPYVDVDLLIKVRMFSFICGEGLVFDQSRLVSNGVLMFYIKYIYTSDNNDLVLDLVFLNHPELKLRNVRFYFRFQLNVSDPSLEFPLSNYAISNRYVTSQKTPSLAT